MFYKHLQYLNIVCKILGRKLFNNICLYCCAENQFTKLRLTVFYFTEVRQVREGASNKEPGQTFISVKLLPHPKSVSPNKS